MKSKVILILIGGALNGSGDSQNGYLIRGGRMNEPVPQQTDLSQPVMQSGKVVNCIPVSMPFIDSLFMPRAFGDRPFVIPKGSENFAFLGQFTEVEDDCVFTVEYSVRTAQEAVYGFFDCDKEPIPVYVGAHNQRINPRTLKIRVLII